MKGISEACRSCMLHVAAHERREDPELSQMFSFCTNVIISEVEKLPQHFCLTCSESIESCFSFINKARKVDFALRHYLSVVGRDLPQDTCTESYTKKETANCDDGYGHNFKVETDSPDEKEIFEINIIPNSELCEENVNFDIQDDKDISVLSELKGLIQFPDIQKGSKRSKRASKKCPRCIRTFSSIAWYEKHVKTAHQKDKRNKSEIRLKKHLCSICSKGFSRSDILNQHMVTHSDVRPFSCHLCPRKFKLRNDFNRHVRMHSEGAIYKCDHCKSSFTIKSSLLTHMRTHDERNRQLCSLCGAEFNLMGNLVQHMRTHTGEKPFSCPQCPYRCALSSSMRRHKLIHDGAKPHTCNTCGKKFRDYSGMVRHVRTHTGERPYRCTFCSEAFIDTWKRKLHIQRHHPAALTDFLSPAVPPASKSSARHSTHSTP